MVAHLLRFALFAALLTLGLPALAQSPAPVTAGPVTVSSAWARSTPPSARTGAASVSVANTGSEPDRLVGAASPAAGQAELHTHVMEGGIARMRQLQAIDLPAGGKI